MANKYNNTRTGATSWWPIKQLRFDTTNHPAIKNGSRATQVRCSHNERQMFEGLARVLQCSEVQAMRIVLHEVVTNKSFTITAENIAEAKIGGSTMARNKSFPLSVSKAAKSAAIKTLKEVAPLSEPELLRLALVSFSKGLRDESIKRLAKSRKKTQQELAKEWGKDPINNKKTTSLTALRESHDVAFDEASQEAYEQNQALYEKRGEYVRSNGLWHLFENDGYGNTSLDTYQVDELMYADERAQKEELWKALDLTAEEIIETRIEEFMLLGMDRAEATACVEQEDGEADEDDLTEEEMEALIETDWVQYTPEEEAELAARRAAMHAELLDNSDEGIELWSGF